MANKRISELSSRTPSATDLMLVGDPTTGYSYKCLVSQVGGVTSVFGRTGAVTAQEGDYSLTSLSDVTITSPASGDILAYNGSSWVNSAGGFVPYTGATQNVSLGEYGILAGWYRLDTTPTGTPTNQGTIYWDDSFNTAAIIMNGTTQEIGHDQFFQVKNSTGSTIPKGTAVRFAGTDGSSGHLLIAPFLADGSNPSSYFMGVTAEAITNGSFGKVQSFGRLDGIDTSAFAEGDLLYCSTTVAGGFQTTVPQAPNNIILVAAVVSDAVNGKILIRPTLGSKLSLDESVRISSPTNGQVLQYNSSLAVWQNVNASSLSVNNIYTADGTLTGNRTVTMGGFDVSFNESANRTALHSLVMSNASGQAGYRVMAPGESNQVQIGKKGLSNAAYKMLASGDGFIYNNGTALSIFSDFTAPIKFGVGSSTAQMQLFSTGNFAIGTTTDAGFRLDVNGTIATNNFINFTANGASGFRSSSSSVSVEIYGGRDVTNGFRWGYSSTMNVTNSTRNLLTFGETFLSYTYQTGTNIGRIINFSHIINTTGGTNTITAIYYNPTLTSTTGTTHRFLHNETGDVLLCTTSGNVGIGTTSPATTLHVNGSIRTANPSGGTAVNWRLGSAITSTVQLDTSGYLEVEVNGTAYKVALAMLP